MSESNSRALTPIASLAGDSFTLKVLFLIRSKSKKDLKLLSSSSTASSASFAFDMELVGLTCDGASARSGDDVAAGRRRAEGAAAEGMEGKGGFGSEEARAGGLGRAEGRECAAAAPMATALAGRRGRSPLEPFGF